MQGELIESSRLRRSSWDGPFGMTYSNQTITGAYTVPSTAPYMIVLSAAGAQNATMYTPPVTNVMWCHELWASGAGTITIKGASAGNPTIGTVAAGKRAEIVWNPMASPQDWVTFLSA
jgi:hypothetical protein